MIAEPPGGDSIPTLLRRIAHITDPNNLIDDTGYVYATENVPADVGVLTVISSAVLATAGYTIGGTLTAAGTTAMFDSPAPGPADAAAVGILVGGIILAVTVDHDDISFDGITLPRTGTATGRPKYPYRASKADVKVKINTLASTCDELLLAEERTSNQTGNG